MTTLRSEDPTVPARGSGRVLIRYTHDDRAHEQVLEFYKFLRANGVDARIDVEVAVRPQYWPGWMRAPIRHGGLCAGDRIPGLSVRTAEGCTREAAPVRPTVGFGVFGADGTGPGQTGDGPSSRTLDDLAAERGERHGTTQLLSAGQSRCVEHGRDLLHQAGSVVEVCWRQ